MTGLWIAWGPRGYVPLLVLGGIYLVGPLWIAVRYRVDAEGVERATAFGRRRLAWGAVAAFRVSAVERSAWVHERGRGRARFLPPMLLLWEADAAPGFAAALEARLAAGVAAARKEAGP